MPTIPEAPLKGVLPEEAAYPLTGVLPTNKKSRHPIDSMFAMCANSYAMSTAKKPESLTEVLRQAISESGFPYKTLSRETGVARTSIQRLVDGRRSIRLDMADRLAAYFELLVIPKPRPRQPKSKP